MALDQPLRPSLTVPGTNVRANDARFPPFRFRSSVAISPLPLAIAVSVHTIAVAAAVAYLCRGLSASMIGWPAMERNKQRKNRT